MAPTSPADALPYLAASGISATLSFPLWKAAAISQSGYTLKAASPLQRYVEALRPPWRGCLNVVAGMTWARASIFFGSDEGRRWMQHRGYNPWLAASLPPTLISIFVQVVNQPFTRASVTLQNPTCTCRSEWLPTLAVLQQLLETRGVASLWLGTSAALLKVVPKYVIAVSAKDYLESRLPACDGTLRSAVKSVVAALAGATLTNPFDVVRNEMFKTHAQLIPTVMQLWRTERVSWLWRGCAKNMVSVALPIASTLFLTDVFVSWRHQWKCAGDVLPMPCGTTLNA